MTNRRRLACTGLALTIVFVAYGSPHLQTLRTITENDLLKFTWIADPQLSPDGSQVAFVRVVVNEKDDRYETSIFVVPASGQTTPRRFTSGTRDVAPRWSPDGKRLAFLRSIERDGKPEPAQIFAMPLDGGEAYQLTSLPKGVGAVAWSPDGRTI